MLETTISLYAFPSHNTVKIEHMYVKIGQTHESNRLSITKKRQTE